MDIGALILRCFVNLVGDSRVGWNSVPFCFHRCLGVHLFQMTVWSACLAQFECFGSFSIGLRHRRPYCGCACSAELHTFFWNSSDWWEQSAAAAGFQHSRRYYWSMTSSRCWHSALGTFSSIWLGDTCSTTLQSHHISHYAPSNSRPMFEFDSKMTTGRSALVLPSSFRRCWPGTGYTSCALAYPSTASISILFWNWHLSYLRKIWIAFGW